MNSRWRDILLARELTLENRLRNIGLTWRLYGVSRWTFQEGFGVYSQLDSSILWVRSWHFGALNKVALVNWLTLLVVYYYSVRFYRVDDIRRRVSSFWHWYLLILYLYLGGLHHYWLKVPRWLNHLSQFPWTVPRQLLLKLTKGNLSFLKWWQTLQVLFAPLHWLSQSIRKALALQAVFNPLAANRFLQFAECNQPITVYFKLILGNVAACHLRFECFDGWQTLYKFIDGQLGLI